MDTFAAPYEITRRIFRLPIGGGEGLEGGGFMGWEFLEKLLPVFSPLDCPVRTDMGEMGVMDDMSGLDQFCENG